MDFGCLHDEIILHIFSFLVSDSRSEDFLHVRQVCKRWRIVADTNLSLWRKIKVTLWAQRGKEEENRVAYRYLKVAPLLEQVTIINYWPNSLYFPEIASKIVQHHPKKIRKLGLSAVRIIDGKDLSKILQCFGDDLEELKIIQTKVSWNSLRGESRTVINLPKLKVLTTNLSTKNYHERFQDYVEVKCPNFTEIVLYIEGEESQCKELLENHSFLRILKRQLTTLTINLTKQHSPPLICDSQEFINYFPSLKALSFIPRFYKYDESHFKWFMEGDISLDIKFPNWYNVYQCFGTDLRIDKNTINSIKNLTFRFHKKCSPHTIFSFLKNLPKLRRLNYIVIENENPD